MLVSDFDYALPPGLIAQHPPPRRRASRLLHLDAAGRLRDLEFAALPGLLGPREALALIRASHPPQAGSELFVESIALKIVARHGDLYQVSFSQDLEAILERHGAVPLPPYITHAPQAEDAERYQTVYAARPGAVAAPTAGLHFDDSLLQEILDRKAIIEKITLHVGAGTFQPVRVEEVEKHRMHKEVFSISRKTIDAIRDKRILAVGTTSLRALETHALTGSLEGETDLFVYPGFQFKMVNRLLTNFHLPKSTLLMLACAFGGKERVLSAYHHAVQNKYRFFSYGDAMLIERG